MKEKKSIDDALVELINTKIKEANITTVDRTTCMQTYALIFDTLVEVMSNAKINLTNESMNFLAQSYYDSVRVNGRQQLDPNIFTQRAKLENIEMKEVATMFMLLRGTTTSHELALEIKRRS